MKQIASCLLVLSACSSADRNGHADDDGAMNAAIQSGTLENELIVEASGLARSIKHGNHLWVINDGGSPTTLYAIGPDGSNRGEVEFADLRNFDWEDLASFEFEGSAKLLIADVGDNLSIRDHATLYVVDEPDLEQQAGTLSWQVALRYPDGPRDVEAVAVDSEQQRVYLLAKRTVPAELYSVPLRIEESADDSIVTATFLGTVESIPQPSQEDKSRAPIENDWHWQPTAMDFSADGKRAVILTYRAAYLYERRTGDSWLAALQGAPRVFTLGEIREAESVALDGDRVFFTVEAEKAPLFHFNLKH